MKLTRILFSVLLHHVLVSGGNVGSSQGQVEVESDGSTTTQEASNCDNVCEGKVSEVVSAAREDQENLHGQIRGLQEELAHVQQQLREAWEAKDNAYAELERERGNMEGATRECYGEVDSLKQKLGEVELSLETSNKQQERLAGELLKTQEELSAFQQTKFFINTKLIKSDFEKSAKQLKDDFMSLLKKAGLVKA
eukprot:scaffold4481_cov121-Cylindrotheca_fusiformis.AAC.6